MWSCRHALAHIILIGIWSDTQDKKQKESLSLPSNAFAFITFLGIWMAVRKACACTVGSILDTIIPINLQRKRNMIFIPTSETLNTICHIRKNKVKSFVNLLALGCGCNVLSPSWTISVNSSSSYKIKMSYNPSENVPQKLQFRRIKYHGSQFIEKNCN